MNERLCDFLQWVTFTGAATSHKSRAPSREGGKGKVGKNSISTLSL